MFPTSKKSKKNFFLTPLEKSKNFKNSKIFNNIGSYDGLKKKIPKSAKMPLIPLFFIHPVYAYVYVFVYVYVYRSNTRPQNCIRHFMSSRTFHHLKHSKLSNFSKDYFFVCATIRRRIMFNLILLYLWLPPFNVKKSLLFKIFLINFFWGPLVDELFMASLSRAA